MHLADGVLSAPVAGSAAVLAAAGVAYGLVRTPPDAVPRAGVLAALFFVASLVHVPVGFLRAHLLLNGLLGMLLGWSVLPALAVALFLQAILFHYGGIVALGANLVNMGIPALAAYFFFARRPGSDSPPRRMFLCGLCGGALGVFGAGCLMAGSLYFSGREFVPAALLILGAHLPVMVVEGIVTGFVLSFLAKTSPSLLWQS